MPITSHHLTSLKLHQPFQINLFNNDTLSVTITDTLRAIVPIERPDLVIGVYTNDDSSTIQRSEKGELLAWAKGCNLSDIFVQLTLNHTSSVLLKESTFVPIAEEHIHLHVLPIHYGLTCLSHHLSLFYIDCIEKASSRELQYSLVDCNRHRIKERSEMDTSEVLDHNNDVALYEMILFCY